MVGDGRDHPGLIVLAQLGVEGEAQQAITDVFGDRTHAGPAAEPNAHRRQMERDIVKCAHDFLRLQLGDQRLALGQGRQEEIKHVEGLLAVRRHHREPNTLQASPAGELPLIVGPDAAAPSLDQIGRLELGQEEGRQQVGWQKAGSKVDPGVLVDLAAKELGTNRAQFFRGQVDKYTWVDLGSSFLPSDLLAAFLLAQLESADLIQARRRRVWTNYQRELAGWASLEGV